MHITAQMSLIMTLNLSQATSIAVLQIHCLASTRKMSSRLCPPNNGTLCKRVSSRAAVLKESDV